MKQAILVPLDGSAAAEATLPWAVHLARRTGADLYLAEVHAPPATMVDGETLASSVVPDEATREQELDYLASVQRRLQPSGLTVRSELLEGSVVASLAAYAQRIQPRWVVMLSHARGLLARFFLGETAREFVRQSTCPVLLIPADRQTHDVLEPVSAQRVVIPLDGSRRSERILESAADLAAAFQAEARLVLALMGVTDLEDGSTQGGPGGISSAEAQAYLERQAATVRSRGVPTTCHVVPTGSAADVILAEAAARPGTIIAMSTHGRTGLSRVIWGSVADAVIRRAHTPVLVLRWQPDGRN